MSSRISGFYKLSLAERRQAIQRVAKLSDEHIERLTTDCGLTAADADHLIENVVGVYGLPLGIATNFRVNGRDVLVPMVTEEPSVVAACSHAAKLARKAGGFSAESDPPVMIGQLQVLGVDDLAAAAEAITVAQDEIAAIVNAQSPTITALGGGFQGLELRYFPETAAGPMLIVHLLIDVRDAMGANAVNSAAEAVAPLIEELTGGRVLLRILSNLADRRLARASCRVPADALARDDLPGDIVAQRIIEAQVMAEVDPFRAATHNKGIMNGIDAVIIATGNDWRAAEAGAHAYAARTGNYGPLTEWRQAENGDLVGNIELPLAVGIVGGTTKAHPLAQLALDILGVETAGELAEITAAVGLAQNQGALRALATEGIQAGHMALHARQLAVTAGATGEQVDRIAEQLVAEENIRLARAREIVNSRQYPVNSEQ
ncbi:MAG: 3-hydroxy-3-methylglutaryl-coenzyme A reductase [Anaerolineales bacterium]|nr:3-hydroxy-3-methylglutaryl-coenzyme A reductase [Anaerolineales bacterium]